MSQDNDSHAKRQAELKVQSIQAIYQACEMDWERFEELKKERDEWMKENPGRFLHLDDPRDAGRWEMACPDEADELYEMYETAGEYTSRDHAERALDEFPLEVSVRSGWGSPYDALEPDEYRILLCTGGPSVQITGDLRCGIPDTVRVEYQDWFSEWVELDVEPEFDEAIKRFADYFLCL